MAVGKRLSTDEPLTEHDVAARLDQAMMRVIKILNDVVDDPTLHQGVRSSRYLTAGLDKGLLDLLTKFRRGKHAHCILCRDGDRYADDGHEPVEP